MGDQTERIDARLSEIDAFERRVGLSGADCSRPAGAVKYLNMGEDELNALTADQLAVAAAAVGNLAFHFQNEFARWAGLAKRLAGAARRLVAPEVARHQGYRSEEVVFAAVRANPEALRLDVRAQDAQHRADRLAYLAKQAEFAAGLMMGLAAARRRHNRGVE